MPDLRIPKVPVRRDARTIRLERRAASSTSPAVTVGVLYSHERAWRRLTELHDLATGAQRRRLLVAPKDLSGDRARLAHAHSVGAAMGSFLVARERARQALAESLAAHIVDAGSTRGLEAAIVTGLTATINSRLPGYDRLVDAVSGAGGFTKGLNAGAGGIAFLDARDSTVGFVGEDALTASLDVLTDVVGKPGGDAPPFVRGGSGRSNDPALVGMDSEAGETAVYVAAWVLSLAAPPVQDMMEGASTPYVDDENGVVRELARIAWHVSQMDAEEALADAAYSYVHDTGEKKEEPPPNRSVEPAEPEEPADGEKPADGGESTPNPMGDDGAPVRDLRYVAKLLEAYGPRTAGDGEGRSFWVTGGFVAKPDGLDVDPLQDAVEWSLEYPVNLDAMLMSRKRPVNPNIARTASKSAAPAGVVVAEGAAPLPLLVDGSGVKRLPW